MKIYRNSCLWAFSFILLVAIFMVNCSDDREDTICPDPVVPDPDIQNIWPNEDGTSWHYEIVQQTWDMPGDIFWPTEQSVPETPALSDLALLIDSHPIGANPDTVNGIYKLAFDGMMTTDTDVSGQKVVMTLYLEGDGEYASGMKTAGKASFLKKLLVARPDLKSRIMPVLNEMENSGPPHEESGLGNERSSDVHLSSNANEKLSEAGAIYWPTFLSGYCWVKTEDYIGGYGDLDQLLAWKFLESDLSIGHEFTHQLVPEIADDVFLHCRVLRRFDLETNMGVKGAVECLYLVDYGIWSATDINANPLGYTRYFEYGTITYAAEIGPVSSYERDMIQSGSPFTTGSSDITITLIGTNR